MRKTAVADVIAAMNEIAPPRLTLPGDPVGLHSGSPDQPARKIALSLDASIPALREAAEKGADMLVVHHPRFYKGLTTVAETDPSGRRARLMTELGLAVFSAHSNLDLAEGGTNDVLAGLAGIVDPELVTVEKEERLVKLTVFVPTTHLEDVLGAVTAAGAGGIGKYSDCTFRTRGTGTFRCGPDSEPFQGRPGSFEEADEYRLETMCGEFSLPDVLAAMRAAHPYEEAAFDVYPVLGAARRFGLGRVGDMAKAESVPALAARMARATGSRMTQYCAAKEKTKVRRAAVWAGGGVDVGAALACRPDVLVTGELGYHDVETFSDNGIAVVTLGHGHSEEPVLKPLAARMRKSLPDCEIWVGKTGRISLRNS